MKYESNILKRLIDTYGVIGNPRYLSEIIKEFIVRGKELYPQLFTYQSDWLAHIDEFGLSPEYVVSYTGQQIYAPHTKEKPVKRAILKGQTLVNLCVDASEKTIGYSSSTSSKYDYRETLKPNTTYTILFKISDFDENVGNVIEVSLNSGYKTYQTISNNGRHSITFTTQSDTTKYTSLWFYILGAGAITGKTSDIIVLEGDYANLDVPFFTGMQSVKMPVLTTTGKNLFPTSTTLKTSTELGDTGELKSAGGLATEEYIPLTFFEQCIFSSKAAWLRIAFYDIDKNFISLNTSNSDTKVIFTPPSGAKFFRVSSGKAGDDYTPNGLQYQIEKGTIPTLYEPYKSNTLTVNEDVTLRGVGDVQDTLDLMTGEVTERIGLALIDGSVGGALPYGHGDPRNGTICLEFGKNSPIYMDGPLKNSSTPYISQQLPYRVGIGADYCLIAKFSEISSSAIVRVPGNTAKEARDWLKNNPITFIYELETPVIKTVDLTIHDKDQQKVERLTSFEGGTHFTTSSQEGSLLPTVIVDVVTDLEETLNLCSMDGNTL